MRYRGLRISLLAATLFIAACAHKQSATDQNSAKDAVQNGVLTAFWAGRISLKVASEPPQAFFAAFELKGRADNGELTLISPLGSILGIMRWSTAEAVLQQGNSIKRFASTDDLLQQATGAAVPISALFDWLAGVDTPTPGWVADLSEQPNGRITATRASPAPLADLRILLDK